MIKIVFFDAGETIVHPHPSFAELFAEVANRRGRSVTAADVTAVQERIAPHLIDLIEESGVKAGPSLTPEDARLFWSYLYTRFLSELEIDDPELADELFATFSDISSYKLFDDVLPVLAHLERAGYRLGLISNFEKWLQEMLVELEVGHVFDTMVISEIAGVEKPDLRIYEMALDQAGVAPHEAVHVGDSPLLDVDPATATGMRAVLLDRTGRYPQADCLRVTSLAELPGLIAGID